jgi:group I intron endonuclease
MYFVYRITNKINGKIYIGQTNNPEKRFNQHKNFKSKWCVSYISRAIQKYGEDNFTFEIIEGNESREYINKAEYDYINMFNSISPNGYNLKYELCGKITVHEDTKRKLSKINQGRKNKKIMNTKSSKYTGVWVDQRGEYHTSVRVNKIVVSRKFENELLAAEAYDKLVLYLFGDDARINFDDRREEFIKIDLETFYNEFIKTHHTSKYNYVSCNKKKTKWRVRLDILKIPEKMRIDFISSEEEAAHIVDKFIIYYKLNKPLNFPNFKYDLSNFSVQIEHWKQRLNQTSSEKGINCMKNGRWRAYYYNGKKQIVIGYFDSEEDAKNAKNKLLT